MTKKSANWFLTEAGLPIALVLVLWIPFGGMVFADAGHSYERVVGSGDLLAISFTLLISLLVDQAIDNDSGIKNYAIYPFLMFIVYVLLAFSGIGYGIIKYSHSTFDFSILNVTSSSIENSLIIAQIDLMCSICWSTTLATFCYIYFFLHLKSFTIKNE